MGCQGSKKAVAETTQPAASEENGSKTLLENGTNNQEVTQSSDLNSKKTAVADAGADTDASTKVLEGQDVDAAAVKGSAEREVPQEELAAKTEAEPVAATNVLEKMVGHWRTKEGEYSLEKTADDKLFYKEPGDEPLTGTLLTTGSAQYEGDIYQGSQLKGTLRIRIEGALLHSQFKPAGKDNFDEVGFLATKVTQDLAPAATEQKSDEKKEQPAQDSTPATLGQQAAEKEGPQPSPSEGSKQIEGFEATPIVQPDQQLQIQVKSGCCPSGQEATGPLRFLRCCDAKAESEQA